MVSSSNHADSAVSALTLICSRSLEPRSRFGMPRELGAATVGGYLGHRLPDRLARVLCAQAGADPATPGHRLSREARRALAVAVAEMTVPIDGDRGYAFVPQHFLYFFPEPQGHGSLRPTLAPLRTTC